MKALPNLSAMASKWKGMLLVQRYQTMARNQPHPMFLHQRPTSKSRRTSPLLITAAALSRMGEGDSFAVLPSMYGRAACRMTPSFVRVSPMSSGQSQIRFPRSHSIFQVLSSSFTSWSVCLDEFEFASTTSRYQKLPNPFSLATTARTTSRLYSTQQSVKDKEKKSFEMTELERQMTHDGLSILKAAVEAVNPRIAIQSHIFSSSSSSSSSNVLTVKDPSTSKIHTYNAADYDEVLVIAFGKASSAMAQATAEIVKEAMPDLDMRGIVIVKNDHATKEEISTLQNKYNIQVHEAPHPVPDETSVPPAMEILSMASDATDRTLVVCCISGGGSALFCSPRDSLTPSDLSDTTEALLASGMSIDKINVIRKRLELGKGGKLAAMAYPATVLTLVLSDIVGDPLDLIASGPTVPDDGSDWEGAWKLIQEYGLEQKGEGTGKKAVVPDAVLDILQKGRKGELEDTPKSSHPVFSTKRGGSANQTSMLSETVLVGNNELAVTAAARHAESLGYNAVILGTRIEGEARHVAGVYTAMAEQLCRIRDGQSHDDGYAIASLPVALVAGGETTVTLSGESGKGGRNQEIGLVAALRLRSMGLRNVVLASAGTDGTDGPTDAAGAVIDGGTIDRLEYANDTLTGEEALKNHDAYTFLRGASDIDYSKETLAPLIKWGPTGTNVADVCVVLVR